MEIALLVLALTALVFVILVVRVVRAVRRGVRRAKHHVGRAVNEATLAARSAQLGPVGEVARLRRALRASLDSTRGTLVAGSADDPALREALSLLDRLQDHAGQLDGELAALMSREPDRLRVTTRLPELRERAERITRSADSLRFAAQDRARHHQEDTAALDALHEQIDTEAAALRHWEAVEGGARGTADRPAVAEPERHRLDPSRPPQPRPQPRPQPHPQTRPGPRSEGAEG
ncbi:hypothetical protein [Streptomyces sp. B6B3]|uniref:hypothetical protein n=1 Tax=Streptomyces sp. B6B3 TaxID=3153570 RepID=UPI00325DB72B